MGRSLLVIVLLIVGAPAAAADHDPLHDPVCDEAVGCVGVGPCVEGVCVPSPCEPSVECGSEVGGSRTVCETNVSIDGTTCSTAVALSLGTRRQTSAPGVGDVGENRVGVALVATDGHVFAQHLPNSWISPGVQADAKLLSRDLGSTSLGLYRSDIQTEGHGRLPTTPATGPGHRFSQLAVDARHDGGPAGSQHVVVGLILLDLAPESCFVRSSSGSVSDVTCPRVSGLA